MTKVSLSVTVDNEIMNLLEHRNGNKSEVINNILKRSLKTKQGIEEEIEYHKQQIITLQQELKNFDETEKKRIEEIPMGLKEKLVNIKTILNNSPDKIYIWTKLINRDYNLNINTTELNGLIERWA